MRNWALLTDIDHVFCFELLKGPSERLEGPFQFFSFYVFATISIHKLKRMPFYNKLEINILNGTSKHLILQQTLIPFSFLYLV